MVIGVDRAVVKTKLAAFTGTVSNGTAKIDGWKLNTTNTKYFPYAELVTYQMGGKDVDDAKYRKDPNFIGLAMNGPLLKISNTVLKILWMLGQQTRTIITLLR